MGVLLELVHLPYYFFTVTLSQENGSQHVGVAVDGVLAATMFFVAERLASEPRGDRALCGFAQSPDRAREVARDEYRSLLLEHGLRSRRVVSVQEISEPDAAHYPFWVAYFKRGRSYDFRALDAVSGEIQGVRMRKVFLAAFRQMREQDTKQENT